MFGKLTAKEIDRALEKIRSEYDHYIVHYLKTPAAKTQFEDRLRKALGSRFDMTTFVGIEIRVVKELIAQEEAAQKEAEIRAQRPPKPTKSYADRVIEKLQRQIQDYPSLDIHKDANLDLVKLYGTLDWFREKIWSVVLPILRQKDPDPDNLFLEDEMASLTPYQGRLPKELESYKALLMGQSSLSQLSKAQNRCILLAAQHVHRLYDRVAAARERSLSPREKELMDRTFGFLEKVIRDFRLKDLRAPEPRP